MAETNRGSAMKVRNAFAAAILTAALLAAGAAAAQDAASSYHVGEHVELKPTPWQDIWEEGVIQKVLPQYDQVVIKSPSAERAFEMKDVRHMGAQAAAPPAEMGAGPGPADAAGFPPPMAEQAPPPPAMTLAAADPGSRLGERVSVAVGGSCCYDGTIIGMGSGSVAGFYLIHFDNPASQDQYANPKYVYARGTRATPPPGNGGHIHCVMGTIGGKPACLPTAAPG